jgi:hypothetical protein
MIYVSLNIRVPPIDILSRLESGALYCVGGIAFALISAYELSGRLNTDTVGTDHFLS